MAPQTVIEREAPAIVSRAHTPTRSRLPSALRVPILVVLNLGINMALWEFASNFLTPELGAVSKVPNEHDDFSLYSPGARIAMRIVTVWMTWYFSYDCKTREFPSHIGTQSLTSVVLDVAALTVLTQLPFAYLLTTFYEISALTASVHTGIEVLSIAIPTYLLRPRSVLHKANAPLRNRYLLNSVQVQTSAATLAVGVYVTVLWVGLKTGFLNLFLVQFFDIPTLEFAHLETPISIAGRIFPAGLAAKEFLLNPSIAAQPTSGATTPADTFDAAVATLPQTVKYNVWRFDRRTRTLIIQTTILNAFVFANTVQRAMTLNGTELLGAAGYATIWTSANSLIALWYYWVGDSSADYEPL